MESLGTGGAKGARKRLFPFLPPSPAIPSLVPQKALTIKGKRKKAPVRDASGLLLYLAKSLISRNAISSFLLRYRISLPSWLYPSSIFGLLIGLREQ